MKTYNHHLKPLSRNLRNNMTDCEQILWQRLRHKQICGVQFYRQKPLGQFIVDFYAPVAKLVIEVDGNQHATVEHQAKDRERDAYLNNLGLSVMRFGNMDIICVIEVVIEQIYQVLRNLKNPP